MIEDLSAIVGPRYVLTGADTDKWGRDWTGAYVAQPLAVVRPADTAEVAAVMAFAHAASLPVVPVSGNTGLNGGAHGDNAIVLSLDRLNSIETIDVAGRSATVGAGVVLTQLHDAVAAHDLIFPMTFGARGSAMVGGILSTNAGGSNVVRYGNTRDLVLGIEVVMADGRIMDLMTALHKDNSGLNLRHLMIGAEGTLGIITRAIVKLFPKPAAYATATVAVPTLTDALALLHRIQAVTGGAVEAFEYMPAAYIAGHLAVVAGAKPPFAKAHDVNLLIEVGEDADRLTTLLAEMLEADQVLDAVIAQNEAQRQDMWARREAAAEITFHRRPFVDTDVAVALPMVERFLTEARARLTELDPEADDLSVAHLGDGNIHYTAYPSRDDPALKDAIKEMVEDVVTELRGSFSAEHGVGISKLKTMARRKDPVALDTMRAIKAALDPKGILNPGKLYPPKRA
ncbi:FAD/FMN-containing dehydrogenase [Cognatiyoonia koreensis]|uniref:FAD/FMN-containing dehydrogenase n=1 Tax=Cognatiyoonia koreensis TaxID=364200 RepID=A0A1I0RBS8_9RHOB|nr:FAD-binding oxidoreductase [Cognatiyoonia koreensis]SEW38045.1 FAD/FMN-containing dehydrogenase [Cognatiyoonia koreensis]